MSKFKHWLAYFLWIDTTLILTTILMTLDASIGSGNFSFHSVFWGNLLLAELIALIVASVTRAMTSQTKKAYKIIMLPLAVITISLGYYFTSGLHGPITESNGRDDVRYTCEYSLDKQFSDNSYICALKHMPTNLGDIFRYVGLHDESNAPSQQTIAAFISIQCLIGLGLYRLRPKLQTNTINPTDEN